MAKLYNITATKEEILAFNPQGGHKVLLLWVFDDPKRNILNEPFMTEASRTIDALVGGGATRVRLTFSTKPFAGFMIKLTRTSFSAGGANYSTPLGNVWLCKVVKTYFHRRPRVIYAAAERIFS